MLSLLTLDNGKGEAVVIHEDSPTSKRVLIDAAGLAGVGALRESKRPRPQAHGGLNETRFEDGRTIQLTCEVWGTTVELAFSEFRKVSGVMLETLDTGGALMKWTEASSGNKLQRFVTLDSDIKPILKGATGYMTFPVQFYAEDPRAYSQTQTTETGAGITGAASEQEFVKDTATYTGLAIDAGHIYFAGKQCIGRCTLAGGTIEPEWLKTPGYQPSTIAVNAANIFWTSNIGIGRATIAGGTIEGTWRTNLELTEAPAYGVVQALAIDAGHIYYSWTSGATTAIGRMTLAGGTLEKQWVPLGASSTLVPAIAVNSEFIFYCMGATIGRATIAGAEANNSFITGTSEASGIALSATLIYWTNKTGNTIGRAKLAGTEVNQSFYSGLAGPGAVAVNASNLFWNNVTTGFLGKANLAGGPSGGAVTIAQAGNRPTPLTFKVHGPCVNPSIVRESDGSRIVLNGTIAAGNYIEVNTAERTVKLNGTSNALSMLNAQNTNWEAFAPLASTKYFLSATSATAAFMEALYRSAYA